MSVPQVKVSWLHARVMNRDRKGADNPTNA
jgi:hypothetical protein